MDKHGIEKAVISTVEVFNRPRGLEDTKRINDLIAEYVVKYGDRFPIGLGTIGCTSEMIYTRHSTRQRFITAISWLNSSNPHSYWMRRRN